MIIDIFIDLTVYKFAQENMKMSWKLKLNITASEVM